MIEGDLMEHKELKTIGKVINSNLAPYDDLFKGLEARLKEMPRKYESIMNIEITFIIQKLSTFKNKNFTTWNDKQWNQFVKSLSRIKNKEKEKPYSVVPNSPALKTLKDFIQFGDNIKNERVKIKELKYENQKNLTYLSTTAEFEITINADIIGLKQDENFRKLFNFFMIRVNQQNKLEMTYFKLSELVELGIYKTEESAYKGVTSFFDKLMNIRISGKQWRGYGKRKEEKSVNKAQVLLEYELQKGKISFFSMREKVIQFLFLYYNLLPDFFYQLTNLKAIALTDHIYYMMTQRKSEILKTGTYSLSMQNVADALGLPNTKETKKHSERITKPILEAIEHIELIQEINDPERLKLTPIYNFDESNMQGVKDVNDFLKNGKLLINISPLMKNYLKEQEMKKNSKKISRK